MLRFVVRRIIWMLPLLLLTSVVTFFLYSHEPGDPVYSYVPLDTPKEDVELVRHAMGLDQPWHVQYWRWLSAAARGDLGRSMHDRQRVAEKFAGAIPVTVGVFSLGFVISLLLGIAVGVLAAVKRYSWFDIVTTFWVYLGQAVPGFWFALMLILVFTAQLHWLPALGLHTPRLRPTFGDTARHLVMPVGVIVWEGIAGWARYVRASMLEVLRLDFVRTARAKGLAARVVVYKHALRNALLPVITFLGFSLSGLVGGSVVLEQIFAIPGMGRVTINAAFTQDYPVLMAAGLLFPVLTMVGLLLSDLLYSAVDPRIRFT